MNHSVMELLTKIDAMRDKALVLRSMVETHQDEQHIRHTLDQITDMARQVASSKFDKDIKVGKK
jgi:hypothetical protein